MKKKVMKQIIRRQREQIENLTKALALMSELNKKRNVLDIPARVVPYVNGTRLDPILNKRTTSPGLANSIRETEKENQEFVDIPISVYGDPSFYPDGMKTFSSRAVKADAKHGDTLGGAAKLYAETKTERKEAVVKDIDESSMYPSRMKSFNMKPSKEAQTFFNAFEDIMTPSSGTSQQPDSFVKKIYPKMSSAPSGDYDKDNALLRLEDDDYVYMESWTDLLADMQEVGLPVDDISYGDLSTKLSTMNPVSKLVLARATMDKGDALDATIWIIEALRFMDRECSDGNQRADHDITINPVHDMLFTAFKTASYDTIEIMRKALEEHDNTAEGEN